MKIPFLIGAALLLLAVPPMAGWAQEAPAWGEAVQGMQLRVEVADGPLPLRAGELLPLQAQIRNRGARPVSFVGEAIVHAEIEVDGVWYVQAWAGSCCSSPREIRPGGKSEVFSFRVLPRQTFALNVTPARVLDLKPGTHSIRIRSASRDSFYVRSDSTPLVLTSNVVTIGIPARTPSTPLPSTAPPACEVAPGRRSDLLHGAVERGDRFAQTMGGWILRLEPVEHGWVLQIATKDRPTEDLSRLTPPWHVVPNPRDIEGWHFRNADNTAPNDGTVNAPGNLREFIFSPLVGREIDYSGSATTSADVEKVRAFGRGWLFLESYRLTPARNGERAGFDSLTFWACLTWPAG